MALGRPGGNEFVVAGGVAVAQDEGGDLVGGEEGGDVFALAGWWRGLV